jgi:hypothetical protein
VLRDPKKLCGVFVRFSCAASLGLAHRQVRSSASPVPCSAQCCTECADERLHLRRDFQVSTPGVSPSGTPSILPHTHGVSSSVVSTRVPLRDFALASSARRWPECLTCECSLSTPSSGPGLISCGSGAEAGVNVVARFGSQVASGNYTARYVIPSGRHNWDLQALPR